MYKAESVLNWCSYCSRDEIKSSHGLEKEFFEVDRFKGIWNVNKGKEYLEA